MHRVNFGRDYEQAIIRFRQWESKQKKEETTLSTEDDILSLKGVIGSNLDNLVDILQPYMQPDDIAQVIPQLLEQMRIKETVITDEWVCKRFTALMANNPHRVSQITGISELANLHNIEKPKGDLLLKKILEFYLQERNPTKKEVYKIIYAWNNICRIIQKNILQEISQKDALRFKKVIENTKKQKKYSNSWQYGMVSRPKTILNHYLKYGTTHKAEIRKVIDYFSIVTAGNTKGGLPQIFTKEEFHKLLDVVKDDIRGRAALLLALNCGYYGKDIEDIKKSMIRSTQEYTYIYFPREKTGVKRINVLWQETIDAINQLINDSPKNKSDSIFIGFTGSAWSSKAICRWFNKIKQKVGVDKYFSNFRDTAASALFGKINPDLVEVFLGHQIRDERIKYVEVFSQLMKPAADIIYQEYMAV